MTTALIGAVVTFIVVLAVPVLASLASDEARGWLPYFGRHLLRSAARRLPEGERARYAEEWRAEHAAKLDRPFTAICFAIQVRLKAHATAVELKTIGRAAKSRDGARDEASGWGPLVESVEDESVLVEILGLMTYRERRVVELLHGLGGETPRSYDEIGRTFNVSAERISQIEGTSWKKLLSLMEAQKLRDVN